MCQPGKPFPPGAVPLHLPFRVRWRELPQREIGGVALLGHVDPLACLKPRLVETREITVIRLLAGVEVDAVRSSVRVALLLEIGDELDLLADVVGGARQLGRRLDVERPHVLEKGLRVEARDLPGAFAGAAGALLHLVLAFVGVGDEMPDVGDVHHVQHAIPVPLEHALEHVLEQEGAEVADVLVVVDRRTAGVHPDRAGLERREVAQAARVVVVELERRRGHSGFVMT